MNRNDFLKTFAGMLAGLGIAGPARKSLQAQDSERAVASALDDSYLVRGLTGMVRSQGWFDAHWGAAVIAGYYLCRENRFDESTTLGIKQQLDTAVAIRGEQFAALPDEASDRRRIKDVAAALRPAVEGGLRAHGHAVIYASLALRALGDVPHMATPTIIQGLYGLSRQIAKMKPEQPADAEAYPNTQAMIEATFDSLARFKELVGRPAVRRPNFTHMVTHTEALMNLAEMGYADVAETGRLGHRAHIAAPVPAFDRDEAPLAEYAALDDVMSGDFWHDPDRCEYWKRKWNEHGNPNGDWIASGHLFKVLYAYHRLVPRIEDREKVRLCSAILLERYVNPEVRGG